MSVRTRRNKIIKILKSKNTTSVKDLAGILDVSEMTLYRDINELGDILFLSKGNIIYNSNDMKESPYHTRKLNNTNLKIAIARSAINYINNNDTIFLDGSSTIGYLASELTRSDLSFTVVTISPIISIELSNNENIKVLCPGGMLDSINMIYNTDIEDFLETININKAFISCGALSLEKGLTDMTMGESYTKKNIINKIAEINTLVDHSKLNKSFSYTWSNFEGITRIIIDDMINKKDIERLKSKNIEIILGKIEVF